MWLGKGRTVLESVGVSFRPAAPNELPLVFPMQMIQGSQFGVDLPKFLGFDRPLLPWAALANALSRGFVQILHARLPTAPSSQSRVRPQKLKVLVPPASALANLAADLPLELIEQR